MNPVCKYIEHPLSLCSKYHTFIFDMDGVLWRGNNPLPNSFTFLNKLEEQEHKIHFLTNNSTLSRQEYQQKLKELGYISQIEQIHTAGYIVARECVNRRLQKVLVIGSAGLVDELCQAGVEVVQVKQNNIVISTIQNITTQPLPPLDQRKLEEGIQAVIIGSDRQVDYNQLTYAGQLLLQQNNIFICTNPDISVNVAPIGQSPTLLPGTGCLAAFLSTFSNRTIDIMLGKPNPYYLNTLGLGQQGCLFVGDNLYTDILVAQEAGIHSLLVLTGVTNQQQILQQGIPVPTYYTNELRG